MNTTAARLRGGEAGVEEAAVVAAEDRDAVAGADPGRDPGASEGVRALVELAEAERAELVGEAGAVPQRIAAAVHAPAIGPRRTTARPTRASLSGRAGPSSPERATAAVARAVVAAESISPRSTRVSLVARTAPTGARSPRRAAAGSPSRRSPSATSRDRRSRRRRDWRCRARSRASRREDAPTMPTAVVPMHPPGSVLPGISAFAIVAAKSPSRSQPKMPTAGNLSTRAVSRRRVEQSTVDAVGASL